MGRFKPSYTFDHELRTNPRFIGALVTFAEPIAQRARELAPVGESSQDNESPGAYRDSIHVEVRTGKTGRQRVAVVADNFKAVWIEFGTAKMAARAVLRKAARQRLGSGKRHGIGAGTRTGTVRNTRKRKK